MKLFLTLANNEVLNSYINVDPIAAQQNPNKVAADPSDLSSLIDNGEAEEILAPDVLDYYILADKIKVLEHWLGKLGHEGTITIGGLDIHEAGRLMYLRELNVQQTNELLYGVQNTQGIARRSLLTLQDVTDVFSAKPDYTVLSKQFNGMFYLVTAQRN